ncbi:MAG: hypothetical protein ACK4N4_02350 [Burkholderiales bacterium]
MKNIFVMLALGLAGCGTLGTNSSPGNDSAGNEIKTIVPNKSLNLSRSLQIPLEGLLLGTAIYLVVDPLSPNWRIEESRAGDDAFRLALRRKPFASGGEGEAMQVLQRRAEQLARDHGRSGYTIVEFTEGIESTLPLAQRVSHGVVRLH